MTLMESEQERGRAGRLLNNRAEAEKHLQDEGFVAGCSGASDGPPASPDAIFKKLIRHAGLTPDPAK